MTDLDPFEIKILREMQRDASQTTAEIAERVGLSVSPCWRRIDRLEREGEARAEDFWQVLVEAEKWVRRTHNRIAGSNQFGIDPGRRPEPPAPRL